ncbi:hypothetical protein HOM13_02390 [Candidatus Woesearchaeota archaeon]|jgi:flagellin-like protein|nr:hypothetical protein [Candidatus Woesearchaeota archaeon]MBT5215564.1 hypothetical protein [Candidatus Woesearchaeota archaeon]MBT6401881.1 hypothetical protein [Candidatus Woesearchaeota archaeon]
MRRNKKGISPLIATVLLIGFAVALAAVVMTWGLDFIKSTADATESQTQNTLICASDLSFAISDVNPSEGSVTVDNRGQVDIKSVIFRIYGSSGVDTLDSSTGELNIASIPKFGVKKFMDNETSTRLIDLLGSPATKVEAIATVAGDAGEEDIVCPQNIQEFNII